MFHATAVVADYDATMHSLDHLFGCVALNDTVDETPGVQRRGGMAWIGDNSIEIAQPLVADSPGGRFLARTGGGMHSFGVQVSDIAATKEHLVRVGVGIASEPLDGIVFTNPSDTSGLLIEWCAVGSEEDPRFGATVPKSPVAPIVPARRVAFVGAVVEDPLAAAHQLARVLDGKLWIVPGDDARLPPVAVSLGDCMLALFPLVEPARPRVHAMGLLVDDVDSALDLLQKNGIGISWHVDSFAAIDEQATPLPLFITDTLLPGDPRH